MDPVSSMPVSWNRSSRTPGLKYGQYRSGGTGRNRPLADSKQATVKSREQVATGRVLATRFLSDCPRGAQSTFPTAPDGAQRWGRFFAIRRCEIGHSNRTCPTQASGSMSGDGKRSVAEWPKLPRPSSTLPKRTNRCSRLMSVDWSSPELAGRGSSLRD